MKLLSEHTTSKDCSLVFCAAAGQGLQTAEELIAQSLVQAGYSVFSTKEYMSRVRGGNNSTRIRVSLEDVRSPLDRIDYLFLLTGSLRPHIIKNLSKQTKVIGDISVLTREAPKLQGHVSAMLELPLTAKAKDLGGSLYEATLIAGVVAGLFSLNLEQICSFIESRYTNLDTALRNKAAFQIGHELGMGLNQHSPLPSPQSYKAKKLCDGNTAVALGAAAAGCNFVTAYPMSPGTALFSFFARNAELFDCAVEQVEDEISAINMGIGAAYAGARALVTTSGGGFTLMSEGLSLAGITETPIVVHLAQRPGPATGMATRTEQSDLNLALYSGHGEFPRALFAPSTQESAFQVVAQAFATASKYQTPSIILTDQYFLDSSYEIPPPALGDLPAVEVPVRTPPDYQRYAFPKAGYVSPRGVPGYGKGLVGLDSHEHTEAGHISEDFDLRVHMTDKRLLKLEGMKEDSLPPKLFGDPLYRTLIICWGSVFNTLLEVINSLDEKGVALLCCEQIYPLSSLVKKAMQQADRRIFVENNATGQFARLVHSETGYGATETLLKYDGQPFSFEELCQRLRETLLEKKEETIFPRGLILPENKEESQ